MTSINSRSKGRRGEQEVAREIEELLGFKPQRNLSQVAVGGYDLIGIPGWAVEVKLYKKITKTDREAFWNQAVRQARKEDLQPAVWFRVDRQPWRVMIAEPWALANNIFEIHDHRVVAIVQPELWAAMVRENMDGTQFDNS